MKSNFNAPLAYQSGKHKLAGWIASLIPQHELYCEPFCGSASVFFTKEPSRIEVLNDTDTHLVTFFEVVQSDFGMLKTLVDNTPCSRHHLNHARWVLRYPAHFEGLKRAWAFRTICNLSF